MKKFSRALICGAALLLGCGCAIPFVPNFRFPSHDPDQAAVGAIVFAREAFVDLNQPEAYNHLSAEVRQRVSFEQYLNVIARMHPHSFPKEVVAIGHQPIPHADAVFIWMRGEGRSEQFYYRLTMRGKPPAGYSVGEMLRAEKMPPQQSVLPLPTRRSTADLTQP